MEVKGKVVKIMDVETFSEKFKKQVVIIEQTDAMYDREIPVEFTNKGIDEISSKLKVDQQVNIGINLAGREWEGRYFVNIRAWRLLENDAIDDVEETIAKPKETDDLPF
tara:strand:+ start:2144 stop:2470 length:327 start_codon:yes stop_codon:yes gene_type:complete